MARRAMTPDVELLDVLRAGPDGSFAYISWILGMDRLFIIPIEVRFAITLRTVS
jgi:hypothetical protein